MGDGVEDILAQAASTTQSMIPNSPGVNSGSLESMQPQPLVQPPPRPVLQVPPVQFAQAGNEFQTSGGRKRADRQAIINNTANMIKAGSDYIQAKKNRNLSMVIERLMSAQQGLQEAQQSGDKQAIARNTAIINDITSDPKISKQLQKAYNIDLFGNGKNKHENSALIDAWKNYNAKKQTDPSALNPTAERLMNSQPMRSQLNPEAQAQAAAIKAGLIPQAGEILKATEENYKTIIAAKTAEDRNIAIENAAKIKADAEKYHADKVIDAANIKALGQSAAAEIRTRAQRYISDNVSKTWDKRLSMMDKWAEMKTGNSPIIKNLSLEAKAYNDRLKVLSTENSKLISELDKKGTSIFGIKLGAMSAAEASAARTKIQLNNIEMQKINSDLDSVTNKLKTLDTMGVINMKELTSGSSDSGSSDSTNNDQTPQDDDVDTGE